MTIVFRTALDRQGSGWRWRRLSTGCGVCELGSGVVASQEAGDQHRTWGCRVAGGTGPERKPTERGDTARAGQPHQPKGTETRRESVERVCSQGSKGSIGYGSFRPGRPAILLRRMASARDGRHTGKDAAQGISLQNGACGLAHYAALCGNEELFRNAFAFWYAYPLKSRPTNEEDAISHTMAVPVSLAVAMAPPAVVAACGSEEPTVWGRRVTKICSLGDPCSLKRAALLKRLARILPLSA